MFNQNNEGDSMNKKLLGLVILAFAGQNVSANDESYLKATWELTKAIYTVFGPTYHGDKKIEKKAVFVKEMSKYPTIKLINGYYMPVKFLDNQNEIWVKVPNATEFTKLENLDNCKVDNGLGTGVAITLDKVKKAVADFKAPFEHVVNGKTYYVEKDEKENKPKEHKAGDSGVTEIVTQQAKNITAYNEYLGVVNATNEKYNKHLADQKNNPNLTWTEYFKNVHAGQVVGGHKFANVTKITVAAALAAGGVAGVSALINGEDDDDAVEDDNQE